MSIFRLLDKSQKSEILPLLFDIFYENTSKISPFSKTYEAERNEWLSEVSPALEKPPRQIILIYHGADLAGFVMYYTRRELLMIEELQLVSKYQRTLLCYKTVKYLYEFLGEKIERIEAYALKSNQTSIGLMQDLGFAEINDTLGTKFLHFSCNANKIKPKFSRK
jgi:hypothetical protein